MGGNPWCCWVGQRCLLAGPLPGGENCFPSALLFGRPGHPGLIAFHCPVQATLREAAVLNNLEPGLLPDVDDEGFAGSDNAWRLFLFRDTQSACAGENDNACHLLQLRDVSLHSPN